MAGCDYKSCDKCGTKTFYDVSIDYKDEGKDPKPHRVGDWKVICEKCAEEYKAVIVVKGKWVASENS